MIKSNKNLRIITATIDVNAVISMEVLNVQMNFQNDNYELKVQDFYTSEDVRYPIEQRAVQLPMSNVSSQSGKTEKERIVQALLEQVKDTCPYGSNENDWEIETEV
jgi:hypothetical protein